MRPGIRLQLVLALAGLMVLAFVPLFFAVTSLARTTLQSARESSARSLGRAVAAHVSEARRVRGDEELHSLLRAEIGSAGLAGIAVYTPDGQLAERVGESDELDLLPTQVPSDTERTRTVWTSRGRALEVLIPGARGPVVALLHTDDESVMARPLVNLVGLYSGIFALGLLVFAYMALTRLIVRPIDQLSAAARRVSEGERQLEVPRSGARELAQLGSSLAEMTRRLRAEEEALRNKVDELEAATEELRGAQQILVRSERLASVGRLAAGLAHEIGNPISAILGFEELLLEGDLEPEEQRDFVLRMKKETERIHRVLRQLLDFARPAAVPSLPNERIEPGSVSESVQDACDLVRPQKAFRKIDLSVQLDEGLPLVGLSRPQLVQVLLNLLLNASDAVKVGHVWVRALRTEGGVRLEVEDDGPGVDEEVVGKLFEPFVTTKEVGEGTGLGLAISRGLVEAALGHITLEKATDGGAKFVIELPSATPHTIPPGA